MQKSKVPKITASEIRNKYLTPKEINDIIFSKGLLTIKPFLLDVLQKSRETGITPIELFELQCKISEKIIRCEKQINLFKKSADRISHNIEWFSREIYKAHRKMLKEVMDGVAFRLLNFQRPVLRQLAHHHQTGHLSEGFLKELEKAEYIATHSTNYVIINDLTNFLRHGDLTIITPEGNFLDEVKTKGAASGKQKKDLDETIKMLNSKIFRIEDQKAQYITIPGRPTSFIEQVRHIIEKSKIKPEGIYAKKVAPYLWVSSICIDQMRAYHISTGKLPRMPESPFKKEDAGPSSNSLMFFDEFSPNIMPYSTFPFSEEVICEIMLGQIQLKVVVNWKEVVKKFKNNGWELTLAPKEKIAALYDTDDINVIKEAVVNPDYHHTLTKGNFNYKLPKEVLLRIETEFRSVKSIVEESDGILHATGDGIPRMVTTDFSEEYLIWR